MNEPLTLGTAGHIDHGKTALVAALTGVETDRLPEERARGLTIVLGYAPLLLPSGRRLSVVDVPGHERFVRTMVAGATGIDAYLMVVAADDGVMPQTREHAAVLRALGVREGVVAITKADLGGDDGVALAREQVAELLPGVPAVACSSRTGAGIDGLRAALDALAARVGSRALGGGAARLHVDRVFTVDGRGTVVTGTLWSGALAAGDELELLPAGARVRVRGLQIHDQAVERAEAGQRVAVNLAGVRARDVARGDALAAPGSVAPAHVLDCALELAGEARHGERVHVHHGTRDVPARLIALGEDLWQLRLDRPVLARDGDRVVVRRPSPPDTLGGGVVLDAAARRHGRRPDVVQRLRRRRDGEPEPAPSPIPAPQPRAVPVRRRGPAVDAPEVRALEARLREAGTALLSEAQLAGAGDALRTLRDTGRAVRVSGRLYGHADAVEEATARIVALLHDEGSVTLAGVRDALGLSRKSSQALLEHLDGRRVTRRLPDDRRVLAAEHARA
ncbi:MAG TPA: selenocysteine-specific translation elongation factor [Baekduia sp.]|nr:selenocysteine-specific translation elongation factor [Baekduia sp.]